ncbi:NUDIX hydrolase [Peptoniphilus equinus]|uniref:NUDIX hydrolase n=1 Tax=Peptoniphilus equinus TaxID=3016343 RepID=A0ABY7QUY5_9FIRM|nr:NUDIX hydrolase [Peptoniphilus equinus]WBW50598.1 NUDIX hydrolase [Peptoniphilus equinus]
MDNTELTIKTDKIYDGKILKLRVDTVELPNAKYSKREIIEHHPAVCVVALTDDDEILMVSQYRKPLDKTLLEIPAGGIELDELPKDAAARELLEETGYRADTMEYLCEFYTTPGFCTEKIHAFFATNLTLAAQDLDHDEFIEVEKIPFDDIIKRIGRCEISDGKSIAAVLYYNTFRRNQ